MMNGVPSLGSYLTELPLELGLGEWLHNYMEIWLVIQAPNTKLC